MKYKRQLVSGMFALVLIAGGTSVYAAEMPSTATKAVQNTSQAKMKSISSDGVVDMKDAKGKDLETKDGAVKKVVKKIKHKKGVMSRKTTTSPVKPAQ